MQPKKIKFDSSRFKNEQENEVENLLKIKINFDSDNPTDQIEQLNQNQLLLKAAQNFFKDKTGDEQKPVKDSIRIFNSFRIRSNSPQHQNQYTKQITHGNTNLVLGQSSMQTEDKKIDQVVNSQTQSNIMNSNIFTKADAISEYSTQQLQQTNTLKLKEQKSKLLEMSQSPTKKLQVYRDMRDQAQLHMTNKQSRQQENQQEKINHIQDRKNKSEWILQKISRFSPQQVLKLDDPIILQAIQNLDLSVEEMKEWIQVSDFYSIQESTRMQMRRYLTALNETFYKIESVIQERDRILQQKIKERNNIQAQHKIEKFFQSYTNSKYYKEFDVIKSSSVGRNQWNSFNNKSDFVNSLSINGDLIEGSNQVQSNTLIEDSGQVSSIKKIKQSDQQFKSNKYVNPSYSPKKQNQNNEIGSYNQNKDLKRQGSDNFGKIFHLGAFGSTKEQQQNTNKELNGQTGDNLPDKTEEEGTDSVQKIEIITSTAQNGNNDSSNNSLKQKDIQRQIFSKEDLTKKLQHKIKIEQRLTNLQLSEALQYEEDQAKLQVALKRKKLLSNQKKQKELQNKIDKIRQRNNYVDERKNNHEQQKLDDENRRFQLIQKMQQEDSHLISIKEKKEEIKQLMAFERDKKTQLKQQVMRDQQKQNYEDTIKKNQEELLRIEESIEIKNQKKQNVVQYKQDKAKSSNDQKAQIVFKQYQQQKIIQEQIAAEVAKKYDKSAEFLDQISRQKHLNIIEINREYDRRNRENQEKLKQLESQENQIKVAKAKLLYGRISSSEMSRKERIENLKKQISQNNLNKANKTMQSFYQTKQKFLEKGEQYLKQEHDNRDAYLDDVKAYEQYLKKCAAIRINQSYEREELISSPKKIRNIAYQIKSGQFKKVDHSF